MLLCAFCLRDPSTGPRGWQLGQVHEGYRGAPYEPEAITILNGNAVCQTHFQRLCDVQNEVHGPAALIHLLERMHAPADVPRPYWSLYP